MADAGEGADGGEGRGGDAVDVDAGEAGEGRFRG